MNKLQILITFETDSADALVDAGIVRQVLDDKLETGTYTVDVKMVDENGKTNNGQRLPTKSRKKYNPLPRNVVLCLGHKKVNGSSRAQAVVLSTFQELADKKNMASDEAAISRQRLSKACVEPFQKLVLSPKTISPTISTMIRQKIFEVAEVATDDD